MKKVLASLAVAGLMMGQVAVAHAATFANYSGTSTSTPPGVQLVNSFTAGPTWNSSTLGSVGPGGEDLVNFHILPGSYESALVTPAVAAILNSGVKADFSWTAKASLANGGAANPTSLQQFYYSVSLTVTAVGAPPVAGESNLLTMTVTSPLINAAGLLSTSSVPASSLSFGGHDDTFGTVVTFTSDYVNFGGASQKAYAWGFSGVTPQTTVQTSGPFTPGYFTNFVAEEAGTFSAIFPSAVPEPGTLSMLFGLGISGSLFLRRRR